MRRSANTHPTKNDGVEYQKNLALTFIDTLLSSQRTRAHHHSEHRSSSFRGNRSSLTPTGTGRKSDPRREFQQIRQALPVQPRLPTLTSEGRGRVGVRVALTRIKLRDPRAEHQIGCFRNWRTVRDAGTPVRIRPDVRFSHCDDRWARMRTAPDPLHPSTRDVVSTRWPKRWSPFRTSGPATGRGAIGPPHRRGEPVISRATPSVTLGRTSTSRRSSQTARRRRL